MGTRLNKNIMVFDVDMGLDKVVAELAKADRRPDYIVLRRPREQADRFWFYVFDPAELMAYLKPAVEQVHGNAFPSLRECLPQLHESESAPVVPANITLPRWSERYDQGNRIAENYPVAVNNNKPTGVWEQGSSRVNTPSRTSILEHLGAETSRSLGGSSSILTHIADGVDINDIINRSFGAPSITRDGGAAEPVHERNIPDGLETVVESTQPANPIQQVFPAIDASSKHPLVGENITLSVSLKTQADPEVSGGVALPTAEPAFVFKLDVHLLCGQESQWDTLEYSQQGGTTKAATFSFTAPDVSPDASGNYPEREKLPVTVNFYYQNRWCGEGRRYLDLLLDETVAPLRRLPKPPESYWSKLIYLEQGAQPPDLLVRISKTGEHEYQWVCLSPHMQFDTSLSGSMILPQKAEDFVRDMFEQYSRTTLNEVRVNEIRGIGEHIYDSTPEAFRAAYWTLHGLSHARGGVAFKNILFITDEPYIPWELMRIADQQRGPGVEAEFLSIRHAVGRWVADCSSRLPQQIPVREMVASGSDYVGIPAVDPPLPWVKEELAWLSQHYQAKTVPLRSADVLNFLKTGTAQAVHFACHGMMDSLNPLRSQLVMEDSPANLRPTVISANEVEVGLGKAHPLIFLNACQVGSSGASLSLMAGFPGAFLKAGASAVISPLWTISDEHAKTITEQFYQAAFANPGATLGEIMQGIHKQWADKQHLTFLAYVLYGDPQARVSFQPVT